MSLPLLPAGVYRHWKGHLYLVLGYGQDSNHDDRTVVVYVGLELDGARHGPRLKVRDADDFHAHVNPDTGEAVAPDDEDYVPRFRYLGPGWNG